MLKGSFDLPVLFDLGATFAFALTGALAAIKRNYDIVGVLALALVSGIGGGLIRDGIFIQQSLTPLLTTPAYLYTVTAAVVASLFFRQHVHRFHQLIAWVDALGLGAYAVFGVQKALNAGLPPSAAVLIGVINAVGGGLLRDVLVREEPFLFKPGDFYALVAAAGAGLFCLLTVQQTWPSGQAAAAVIPVTFVLRVLSHRMGWTTRPARPERPPT